MCGIQREADLLIVLYLFILDYTSAVAKCVNEHGTIFFTYHRSLFVRRSEYVLDVDAV